MTQLDDGDVAAEEEEEDDDDDDGHWVHVLAPLSEYESYAHGVHAVTDASEYFPATQSLQYVADDDPVFSLPGRHDVLASLYVPLPDDDDDDGGVSVFFPVSQSEQKYEHFSDPFAENSPGSQSVHAVELYQSANLPAGQSVHADTSWTFAY